MTHKTLPDEDLDYIRNFAATEITTWLDQLHAQEATELDLIGSAYGAMITASLLGYPLDEMYKECAGTAMKLATLMGLDDEEKDSAND